MVNSVSVIALMIALLVAKANLTFGSVGNACSRLHPNRFSGCHQFHPIGEFVLIGKAYRNKTARSYVTCAVYCLQDGDCKSFNYRKDDELCQLNSVHSNGTVTLQQSRGSFYFGEIQASFMTAAAGKC